MKRTTGIFHYQEIIPKSIPRMPMRSKESESQARVLPLSSAESGWLVGWCNSRKTKDKRQRRLRRGAKEDAGKRRKKKKQTRWGRSGPDRDGAKRISNVKQWLVSLASVFPGNPLFGDVPPPPLVPQSRPHASSP